MKALSVGLLRGSIDEVDKRVHITWVQPRVLDIQQVMRQFVKVLLSQFAYDLHSQLHFRTSGKLLEENDKLVFKLYL